MAAPRSEVPDGRSGPRLVRPLADFLRAESAGGVVLVMATVVALVWANSPWRESYVDLWQTEISVVVGSHRLDLDLRAVINEGLMALFFFVVGLEIKRELVEGELRAPRRAALPAIAAIGGMAVPALLYLSIAGWGEGEAGAGWGIPMATDIAMAVGVVSLLGRRVSASLKLFLLALAIVDDIGAITVIALFYSEEIHVDALLAAAALAGVVIAMRAARVRRVPVYAVLGVVLWLALHESGIHATLTGVVLGLMAPTRPMRPLDLVDADQLADVSTLAAAQETIAIARESVSVVEWLEHMLHPWTSFVIVPLFALANAGIVLDADSLSDAFGSVITYGVVVGLVVGKLVGITGATWSAARSGIGVRPPDTRWTGIVGVAAVGGIGFTVSIFVATLAFDDPALQDQAKVGILAASILSAALGAVILGRFRPAAVDVPSTEAPSLAAGS